jgi:tagatose-6-phosphate ketose/aldose isomerase
MSLLHFAPADLDRRGAAHTAREIAQQPEVWRAVHALVASRREALDAFLQPLLARPDLRIVLTGAGSSAFIGQCLAPALLQQLGARPGIRVEAIATTDIVSSPAQCLQPGVPTLLVSFARSGNSPESLAAVDLADATVRTATTWPSPARPRARWRGGSKRMRAPRCCCCRTRPTTAPSR